MRITRESIDGAREKDGETTVDERRMREEGCEEGCRGGSPGVCPPGRGEQAVTERDGVTKGGIANALEWDIYLLLSSRRVLRKRGRTDTVPMETRRRLSPKILGECSVLSRVLFVIPLSPSPYHALTFFRSTSLSPFRPPSIHPSVCLRLHHFSSDPVTIPMAAFSP